MGQAYPNLAVVLQTRPSFPKMLPVISGNASSKIGNACNCLCGPDLASYVAAGPSPIDIISASQILDTRDFHLYGTYEGAVSLSHSQPLKGRILFTRDLCHPGKL